MSFVVAERKKIKIKREKRNQTRKEEKGRRSRRRRPPVAMDWMNMSLRLAANESFNGRPALGGMA